MNGKHVKIVLGLFILMLLAVVGFAYFVISYVQPEKEIYQSICIQYSDGTWFNSTNQRTSLSIVDPWAGEDGKIVANVVDELHMTVTSDIPIISWSVTGCEQAVLWGPNTQFLGDVWIEDIIASGGTVQNGQDILIFSHTYSASALQNFYGGWVDGTRYCYQVITTSRGDISKDAPLSITFNYAGGYNPETKIVKPSEYVLWTFEYRNNIRSLSVGYSGYGA
jgi:hypothetical protein